MTTMLHLCFAAVVLAAQAGNSERIIIEQTLDQPVTLDLTDAPVGDACQRIADVSGISISIGRDVLGLLPYGEATRVSVRWERTPLRDGIRVLCDQIGMEFFTTERGVEIVPSPPLMRLGRAASWEELSTISILLSAHWGDDRSDAFKDLRKQVRFHGTEGDQEDLRKRLRKHVENVAPGRAADVLTRACAAMGCIWIPWGDEIVIMTHAEHVRDQLQRSVSLRLQDAALADVLLELSRQAGVPIRMDPAAAAALPDRVKENISLIAEGVTVEEALEKLVIAAGLGYDVQEDGIVLQRPPGAAQVVSASDRQRDPIVGKVIVTSPDGKHTYEWFIRESDLTPEERGRLEKLKRDGIEQMKRDLD
jgi:hypothetical protein